MIFKYNKKAFQLHTARFCGSEVGFLKTATFVVPRYDIYPLDTHTLPSRYPIPGNKHGVIEATASYTTLPKGLGTRDILPPFDRMTQACENITFPQLRWRAVITHYNEQISFHFARRV